LFILIATIEKENISQQSATGTEKDENPLSEHLQHENY